MAYAPDVLKQAVRDAQLLVAYRSLHNADDVRSLLQLAQKALSAGEGEIADDEVRSSALHAVALRRLGLSS